MYVQVDTYLGIELLHCAGGVGLSWRRGEGSNVALLYIECTLEPARQEGKHEVEAHLAADAPSDRVPTRKGSPQCF